MPLIIHKEHIYIARCRCGSVVGAVSDNRDEDTARDVAYFIRIGYTVHHMLTSEFLIDVKFSTCACPF